MNTQLWIDPIPTRPQDDRLQVLHHDQEGGDLRAQVRAQLGQEGEEAGGRQEGHRLHDGRQGRLSTVPGRGKLHAGAFIIVITIWELLYHLYYLLCTALFGLLKVQNDFC